MDGKTSCAPHQSPSLPGSHGSPVQYHEMQPAQMGSQLPGVHSLRNQSMSAQSPLSVQTGPHPYAPSTSAGQFRINQWQTRNFDSGVHSMQHSQNPSIMSLHAGSHMSAMSMMENPELTDLQQQKFDNISFNPSNSDGSAMRAIPELLNLMRDEDEIVVLNAIRIMENIAKMDAENGEKNETADKVIRDPQVVYAITTVLRERSNGSGPHSINIARVALGAIFHICGREEGLSLVFQVNDGTNGEVVKLLVHHARTIQNSIHKYALLSLHSILSAKPRSTTAIVHARQIGALEVAFRWFELGTSPKLLSVIVDLLRILCDKSIEQKDVFFNVGGVNRLLVVLHNSSYVNLLWRITNLLKIMSNVNPQALVACGVPLAMAKQLSHGDEKLVMTSLECLRNLSDVRSSEDQSEVLACLLQLFGNRNHTVILYTVQILFNITANHRMNKEFLVRNNAVQYLLRVLLEHPVQPNLNEKESLATEELHQTILSTLRGLCSGHALAADVQLAAFQQPEVFLDKLLSMRPQLLKQTLLIISRIAAHNGNLAAFRELRCQRGASGNTVGYSDHIVFILRVACNQIQKVSKVEDVKVSDLIISSLTCLQSLCRDPILLEQIVSSLLTPDNMLVNDKQEFLPIFVLTQQWLDDEPMRKAALSFLSAVVASPQMSYFIAKHSSLMACLQHYSRSPNREFAQLADRTCRTVMLGGDQPVTSYPAPPSRMGQQHPSTSMPASTTVSSRTSVCPSPTPVEPKDEMIDDNWPEDLSNLAISETYPFANAFVSTQSPNDTPPFSPNSQRGVQSRGDVYHGSDVQMTSPQGPQGPQAWQQGQTPVPNHPAQMMGAPHPPQQMQGPPMNPQMMNQQPMGDYPMDPPPYNPNWQPGYQQYQQYPPQYYHDPMQQQQQQQMHPQYPPNYGYGRYNDPNYPPQRYPPQQ